MTGHAPAGTRRRACAMVVAALVALIGCGDDGGLVPVSGLQTIDVSPPAMIPRGLSLQLVATGTYADGTTADLTNEVVWLSSQPLVATVTQTGLLEGKATGNTDIIVTLGNTRTSVRAIVGFAELLSIEASAANPVVLLGNTMPLFAHGHFTDREEMLTSPRWVSDHPEYVDVSQGWATGVAVGESNLVATQAGVTSAPIRILSVEARFSWFAMASGPAGLSFPQVLLLGHTLPLSVDGLDFRRGEVIDATAEMLWESVEPAIATVSAEGVVTPKAYGRVSVLARRESTVFANIDVIGPEIYDLVVPALRPVHLGEPAYALAIAETPEFAMAEVTRQATWTSSSPEVATISDTGRTKGVISTHSPGRTTLTAALADRSYSIELVVEPAVP